MHADFGSGLYEGGPIGIPYVTVARSQPRVPVSFDYADESNRGPYPIPRSVPIEGGRGSDGDRHVIVVDRARCRLYELFAAYPEHGGARWRAGSGAVWNLRSNRLRPRGWTSADAAGLPILPGLARYDEVQARPHRPRAALHRVAHPSGVHLSGPPLRVRPDRPGPARDGPAGAPASAAIDISRFPRQARVVLRALKRYGMILADNGSPWYVSGAPNRGLGQRRPALAPRRARQRLRGRGHEPPAPPAAGALAERRWPAGPDRLLGLELRRLARAALPGGPGPGALAGALRGGVRHGRGELDLLPAASRDGRGALGRADARPTSSSRSRPAAT